MDSGYHTYQFHNLPMKQFVAVHIFFSTITKTKTNKFDNNNNG